MRWISLLTLLLIIAAPVLAAEEALPETAVDAELKRMKADDDEMVITAGRKKQSTFDTYKATTVFSSSVIADTGRMVAMKAISRRDAAIWYDERTYSTSDPIIRGFAGVNLLTLIDGNSLTTLWGEGGFGADDMFGKIDPDMIERIEVVFGPQSALYGSNSLGAVINIITRVSPIDFTESGFEWGSRVKFDYTSAAAGFGSRLEVYGATPELKFLIGGSHRDFGSVEGGRGRGTLDPTELEEFNWDLAAEFKISEERSLRMTYQNVQRDPTFRYYRPNQDNRNERRAIAFFYRDTSDDGFWDTLDARVYHQYKKDRRHFYTDASRDELSRSGRAITETWQADTQFTKDIGGGHVITAGLSIELDEGDSPDDEQFTYTSPGAMRRDAPLSDWWNYAVYIQDEWRVNEPLSLTGSLRYDYFVFETDVDKSYVPPIGDPEDDQFKDSIGAVTGGIGVVYRLDDQIHLVGSYARGFRQNAPNFGLRQLGDGMLIPNELLDPTTSDNFEIGVKGRYEGISFESFVYYSMIENWQGDLRSTTFNGASWFDFNDNGIHDANEDYVEQVEGGDAHVLGTELRAQVRPHVFLDAIPANWSMWGSFSLNEGRIEKTKSHQKSEPFRHTQPTRCLIGIRWDDIENPKSGLYAELVTDMVARFDDIPSDRQKSDLAWRRDAQDGSSPYLRDYIGTPGYVVFNLYGGVNLCENATLKIGVENLTDRSYRAAHSRMDAPGIDFLATLEITF
jgi:hemoglobin/transferrin/lactoferrin receptor protein